MTSQVIAPIQPALHTTVMTDHDKLRLALRANAMSSASFGLVGLVFAGWVVDVLGAGNETIVRVLAAGLVAFAANVWWVSNQEGTTLRQQTLLISLGDIGWVVGSVAVIALGVFTTAGAIVAALVAVLVFDFAAAQLYTRSRAFAL